MTHEQTLMCVFESVCGIVKVTELESPASK